MGCRLRRYVAGREHLPGAAGQPEPHHAASGFLLFRRKALQAHQESCEAEAGSAPVKEVCKFVNKGKKEIMVLAGATLPIEVYCHFPLMCEDRNLPYVYIPTKTDLDEVADFKRPTCVIMVKPQEEYQDAMMSPCPPLTEGLSNLVTAPCCCPLAQHGPGSPSDGIFPGTPISCVW